MRRLLAAVLVWLVLLSGNAFAGNREFSPRDYPVRLAGKHFVVYYTTKGEDAVKEAYAKEVLAAAEEAYGNLVVKGGMRPPRVEPVPLVLMSDAPSLGGAVVPGDLGFDLWMQINPKMSKDFGVRDTVAHEFFHVLQAAYMKDDHSPIWGIEGTAAVAPIYALTDYEVGGAELGQLSEYFFAADSPMKESQYMTSLFWYWLADRYGGVTFLNRLLTTAESVGWERAAQVAGIQGGAPDDATFDSLWRAFVFALVNGDLPRGYQANSWFDPTAILWNSRTGEGGGLIEPTRGIDPIGRIYSYRPLTVVAPYSFDLLSVVHDGSPLTLTVTGDPEATEAYVIEPGPNIAATLADRSKRPAYHKPAAPPTDPTTRGARIAVGTPVQLQGVRNSQTLVLVLRTGTWGDGTYKVKLGADSGAAGPQWNPIAKVAGKGNSPGSPPPLTPVELAAVKAGTYLKGTEAVKADFVVQGNVLSGRSGVAEASFNDQPITLGAPVSGGGREPFLIPARSVFKLFGGTVQGNRMALGSSWVEVTPGSTDYRTPDSQFTGLSKVRIQGDELLVDMYVLEMLGCETEQRPEDFTVVCPASTK